MKMVGGDGSPRETQHHDEERGIKDLGGRGATLDGSDDLNEEFEGVWTIYDAKVGVQALK
jgi:hypothetical protein